MTTYHTQGGHHGNECWTVPEVFRVLEGLIPSEAVREGLLLVSLPASGAPVNLWHFLACRSITPISVFIVTQQVFSLCVPVSKYPLSYWIGAHPNDLILTNDICNDPISKQSPEGLELESYQWGAGTVGGEGTVRKLIHKEHSVASWLRLNGRIK